MHVLVDADSIVYRAGFATEGEPIANTLQVTKSILQRCYNQGKSHTVFLTGKGNFRKDIYPDYKANRTAPKPKAYDDIREYMVKHHGAILSGGVEADDLVSVAANTLREHLQPHVVASVDKDMLTFPGWKFNFVKETAVELTRERANENFIIQLLMGDKVDNILGMKYLSPPEYSPWHKFCVDHKIMEKKIGLRRAQKVLDVLDEHFGEKETNWRIVSLFQDRKDELELNGKLLWMTREFIPDGGGPVMFDLDRWATFEVGS